MKVKLTIMILIFSIGISVSNAQQLEKSMAIYTHYLLYIPKDLPANGLYPLMLYLHGSGQRGNNLNRLKETGPPSFLDERNDFPFVVVSPQCPENKNWDIADLLILLDHVEATLPVDKNKIYVTGWSMGGFATWNLAMAAPERFAAVAPICGGGYLEALCIMRNVPVWAFHGNKDETVPFEESERLIKKLKEFGSDVKFTVYDGVGHDAWTMTYQNQELYDWLLSKSKNADIPDIDQKVLESYAGKYKSSKKVIMEVIYENKNLYVKSSGSNRKFLIMPFTYTKFRISEFVSGDPEMYFNVGQNGKVEGYTVGPCDQTYYTKIE